METGLHFVFRDPPQDARTREALRAVLAGIARQPDPDSFFDILTRDIRDLPDPEFLYRLEGRGYDAVVSVKNSAFAGFIGFQRYPNELHCFYYYVVDMWRGKGLPEEMLAHLLNTWRKDFHRVRHFFVWAENKRKQLQPQHERSMRRLHAKTLSGKLVDFRIIPGQLPGEIAPHPEELHNA